MKTLRRAALFIIISLNAIWGNAQQTKQIHLFDEYAAQLTATPGQFEKAFSQPTESFISLQFEKFSFSGRIISNEKKYDNLQSIVITSPRFNNAAFHLSRQINKDNSISYVGRIMQKDAADGFELKQNEKGKYYLSKINTAKLLEPCHL
ncbi:MAG: hypothetical protein KF829_10155 [Ferruginibacter sp.]|nr:hypothetical protein [Ferruginibacter sp.]